MRKFHSIPKAGDTHARRRPALNRSICAVVVALCAIATAPAMSADTQQQLNDIVATTKAANQAAAQAQNKIDALSQRTQDAASQYAGIKADIKSYEAYNKKLNGLVQAQHKRIASLNLQLHQIESTRRGISPLMDNMVQTLSKFVAVDLPFLPQKRAQQMQQLQDLMSRVDVTISEKYRIILQDYLNELKYGQTIGAYKGTLGKGKNAQTVQFVRIGRVALMYQTLDGSQTGYWNAQENKWVVDNSYASAFKHALDMANQRGTPQLLTVPVPAPQPAAKLALPSLPQPVPQSAPAPASQGNPS